MQRKESIKTALLTGNNYYKHLLNSIANSKKRVIITAMTVDYDEATRPIFDELLKALERGVEVKLVFDKFTGSPFARGIFKYFWEGRHQVNEVLRVCDNIRRMGGEVTFVRSLGVNHFKGRYHGKAAIVDDEWFSFGGMNFCKEAFQVVDFMLSRYSREEADKLAGMIGDFQKNTTFAGETIKFGKDTALLDGGKPGESPIYDKACSLAKRADSAIYVSQMQPTGVLASELQKIDTTYFFNRPDQFGFPANWAAIVDLMRFKSKNSYRGATFVHAKCILFKLKDGKCVLLAGSHNFSWRGVVYGTQEIALESRDTELWKDLRQFVERNLEFS